MRRDTEVTFRQRTSVPVRDATSSLDRYAAGRYLLDTVKGADLGGCDARLIIAFNHASPVMCV